jgi:hypothetical protein
MRRAHHPRTLTAVMSVMLVLIALPSLAGERNVSVSVEDGTHLCIVRENGEAEIIEIDLSGLHDIVDEALDGVSEALTELEDLKIDVKWDGDGGMHWVSGDQEIYVDLETLGEQVGHVVHEVMTSVRAELADADWHADWDLADTDTDELQRQVRELRAEMKELRRELRRLRDADD